MKIAVYALAKNEEKHATAWAESCKEADYRVVTDTGSTDKTPDILRTVGVTVHTGNVVPWRWDEAHNLSMHHVPPDADICVRLDLDERLQPGWRDAILEAWKPGTTKMRYWYAWNQDNQGKPLIRFHGDRVHSRAGYRWVGATHEGLACWSGEENIVFSNKFEIYHYRTPGKKHSTDLELLQQAVKELPHDARLQWYLARQLDINGQQEAREAFEKYLEMPGGNSAERAYACRVLARLAPEKEYSYLQRAVVENPLAPDAYYALAVRAHARQDHVSALYWASRAVACSPQTQNHTSDLDAFGHLPADIAAVNAFQIGAYHNALHYSQLALTRKPDDERLQQNVEKLLKHVSAKS